MRSFPSLIGVLLLLGFLAPVMPPARADSPPAKPLLMPGKTTLYQRVLTRPAPGFATSMAPGRVSTL